VANLILRLQIDPATGKKDVIIKYESDPDALPMEHEEEHRRIVDRLIEGGALKASELGRIVVERDSPAGTQETATSAEQSSGKVAQKA
jgi:hypothetical protein